MNKWKSIEDMSNPKHFANLKAMPDDRNFEVKFDDGTVCNYRDTKFSFALITHWRELK